MTALTVDQTYEERVLRDEFAKAALAGDLAQGERTGLGADWAHKPEAIAARAYRIADAMMRERDRSVV